MLPGTSVRQAFDHYPPRFRFSPSQRRLLWLALFDDSDEGLMARLEASIHALKKLWRGIYERIEDVAPDSLATSWSGLMTTANAAPKSAARCWP